MSPMRVVLITPHFDDNSLGRTWCIWKLATAAGMFVQVHGVFGDRLWEPLSQGEFADVCVLPDAASPELHIEEAAAGADLLIAIKSLPTSFGTGLRLSQKSGVPLLLDIDDPDIEARTTWRPLHERLPRAILSRQYHELIRLRRRALTVPRMVSNPTLVAMYGGTLVPHVREALPVLPTRDSTEPVIRFVGSVRAHKGIEVLRRAVATLRGKGFSLELTAPPPADAADGEVWLGTTSWQEGEALTAGADIVAVPSLMRLWARAQLPAKLIDGMMAGRPVVASRTPPIEWALGDSGLLVAPGDVDELAAALESLAPPESRDALGYRARRRALELFSVEAVLPAFLDAVAGAMRAGDGRTVVEEPR